MTIYFKAMLAGAAEVARLVKDGSVLLEPDGAVVGVVGDAVFVAEPTNQQIIKTLPLTNDRPLTVPIAISVDQITNIIKAIPPDKQFDRKQLEHLSIVPDGQHVICEFSNGKATVHQRMRTSKPSQPQIVWRKVFQNISFMPDGTMNRFVYNRRIINAILSSIESACKYDGEFEYISQIPFTGGYYWKAINGVTQQTVITLQLLPRATTPEQQSWEKSLYTSKKKIVLKKESPNVK